MVKLVNRGIHVFYLFCLKVFWLFKHFPSSFYLWYLKCRSIFALYKMFFFIWNHVKTHKHFFWLALLALPWKLSLCSMSSKLLQKKYFLETRWWFFSTDFWKRKGEDYGGSDFFVQNLFVLLDLKDKLGIIFPGLQSKLKAEIDFSNCILCSSNTENNTSWW